MAVYAIKQGEESNDRLQMRFKKQVQATGLLKLMRKRSVWVKKPTRRQQRLRALKREGYRQESRKRQFYSNM